MKYLFRRGEETIEVEASFSEFDLVKEFYEAFGWKRVYTAPAIRFKGPGFYSTGG